VTSRARGFTLLEVLVAVALLGLVVSVLAGSAIQGMSYEGDAARRLRASLLADQTLWQLESTLRLGSPPQPAHQESETEDEFRITLDVQPLDLAEAGLGALAAPPPEAGGREASAAAIGPQLPLFQILVRVAWTEGLVEQEVTRSSFAFDATAAAATLGTATGDQAGESPPTREPPVEESEE
jgi:prepilin-type N-terminal cleavage/methylation domain-containing protein